MKKVAPFLALAVAGCVTAEAVPQTAGLAKPERHLMLPACESPPYPGDEGNPDSRARWLVADGQCDALNRSKVDGLQNYARAVTSRSKQP